MFKKAVVSGLAIACVAVTFHSSFADGTGSSDTDGDPGDPHGITVPVTTEPFASDLDGSWLVPLISHTWSVLWVAL